MNEEKDTNEQVEPEVVSGNETQENKKLWAVIAYFIFFLPLLTEHKNNPYVKFHTQQAIVLFIAFVAQAVIGIVPVVGWIAAPVLFVISIVLLIIGVVNAVSGKEKELPLIGTYGKKFNL